MARPVAWSLLMAGVLVCGTLAATQPAPQPANPPAPRAEAQSAAHVTLGQSAVPLFGPWKFTLGDSPIDPKTGQPLWAEPDFDDSKWEDVDLTPKEGAVDPIIGVSGYVPDWGAKGHPGYWGYAWYRIRTRLDSQPGQRLALAGPSDMDDGYEVFANGVRLGGFGDFTKGRWTLYSTRPTMFLLPDQARNGAASQVLAFRVFMEPSTLAQSPEVGGFHNAPIVGDAAVVTTDYQAKWLELIRAYAADAVLAAVSLHLALGAFSLIFFDRSDRVYLWIGAAFLVAAGLAAALVVEVWTTAFSSSAFTVYNDAILIPLLFACWVMVWWVWFGLRRPVWLPRAAFGLAFVLAISNVLGDEDFFFSVISHPVSAAFHIVSLAVRLGFVALLLWIVFQGIRLHGVEGWLALLPVLLFGVGRFFGEFGSMGIALVWFPFGLQISLSNLANLLLALVLALLLLRRLVISLRKQRRMALDVKQAQEVQQVILPQARMTLPGFEIESEYRPALEVGGDFFQIVPHPSDGSLLIVAGDVAGKGLKAGMLVALLVGAIRTAVETDTEPGSVLRTLNRRLIGRTDAQATCLALRIAADGAATLANAGHLPPYLNGEPLPMEGALPLGMMESAEFSLMHFQLKPDDKLVLMSDGIAEATDADGHLFGFERVHELLHTATTAAAVANAAQSFGLEDDISVISVTRTPVLEPALA
jgi:hypothetical protein